MSDNKLIDLHKVAGLFREIQTEEFAKEEANQESEFKKTIKEMEQSVDAPTHESAPMGEYTDKEFACININTGEYGYCDKDELHKYTHYVPAKEFTYFDDTSGMDFADFDDEMADQEGWTKVGDPDVGDPELARLRKTSGNMGEEAVTEDDGDKALALKDWYQNWSKYKGMNGDPLPKGYIMSIVDTGITTDGIEAGEADKAIEVVYPGKGAQMKGDMNQGDAQAYNVDWGDNEIQKHLPITNAMKDDFISIMGNDDEETMQDAWEICSEIWNESVSEDSETGTLQQLLKLAGLKVVTDADINQVEEYSNSPDEEYADADTQLNKMSGGINRPKAMPAVGNQGHNDLVTKLKKAYDSRDL